MGQAHGPGGEYWVSNTFTVEAGSWRDGAGHQVESAGREPRGDCPRFTQARPGGRRPVRCPCPLQQGGWDYRWGEDMP